MTSSLNFVQLIGFALLGGLLAGEVSRRLFALPRTTGFVVFGLLTGQSGFALIDAYHIDSAQLFIDIAMGLILFELGHRVPTLSGEAGISRIRAGLAIALVTGLSLAAALYAWGFPAEDAVFAAALALGTSPAITIATTSDVGARGEKTDLLFTLVAINGCVAFVAVAGATPLLSRPESAALLASLSEIGLSLIGAIALGGACTGLVLFGAEKLGHRPEHQHLLILGTIILGVGTAIRLDISVMLPMLIFGYLTRAIDKERRVVSVRIASDARIFLVITFVLAGAALDIGLLQIYWPGALLIGATRFITQWLMVSLHGSRLGLTRRDAFHLCVGLQPMSSVALVLLTGAQEMHSNLAPELTGTLLASILLFQLFGPPATQLAIKGFGEATLLRPGTRQGIGETS